MKNSSLILILILSTICGIVLCDLMQNDTIPLGLGVLLTIPCGVLIGMLVSYSEFKDDKRE